MRSACLALTEYLGKNENYEKAKKKKNKGKFWSGAADYVNKAMIRSGQPYRFNSKQAKYKYENIMRAYKVPSPLLALFSPSIRNWPPPRRVPPLLFPLPGRPSSTRCSGWRNSPRRTPPT